MRLVWYQEARDMLVNIYLYHRDKNARAAKTLYNDIRKEAERLITFPGIAPIEPLLSGEPKTYRSLVVREHYKLIYHVDEEKQIISIVRIWDCRQDPAKLRIEH